MQFDFDITEVPSNNKDGEVIYKICLKGEFSYYTHSEFTSTITDLLQKGVKKIIIDFNDLTVIDSVAIGKLIKYKKELLNKNGDLVITRCNDQVSSIIFPINLGKIIKVFENLEDGINYFSRIENQ